MESHFRDIEFQILKNIRSASNRLLIAVAWITNKKIIDQLIERRNLDIEIIVDESPFNRANERLLELKKHGINITYIKDLTKKSYIMHNKFCVIDNAILITGSFNWTENARSNDENIVIIEDIQLARSYSQEFRRIKNLKNNGHFVISNDHQQEILNHVESYQKELLRNNINELKGGLLSSWSDERILNKIRILIESSFSSVEMEETINFHVNLELIRNYGILDFHKATEEEKIVTRKKITNWYSERFELHLSLSLKEYQFKALNMLLRKYRRMFLKQNSSTVENRLIVVVSFITSERLIISSSMNKIRQENKLMYF